MSGTGHPLWAGAPRLHKPPRCNGAVFPGMGQSPPTLPDPCLQLLPLPALEVAVFPVDTVYQRKGNHSQGRSPKMRTCYQSYVLHFFHICTHGGFCCIIYTNHNPLLGIGLLFSSLKYNLHWPPNQYFREPYSAHNLSNLSNAKQKTRGYLPWTQWSDDPFHMACDKWACPHSAHTWYLHVWQYDLQGNRTKVLLSIAFDKGWTGWTPKGLLRKEQNRSLFASTSHLAASPSSWSLLTPPRSYRKGGEGRRHEVSARRACSTLTLGHTIWKQGKSAGGWRHNAP